MARTRLIHPEFFRHEGLGEISAAARLLFAGLWTLADREGRLEDRPRRVKADLFPYDDLDIEPLFGELVGGGFVVRYVAEGAGYIAIPAFLEWQEPHPREKASEIPGPCKGEPRSALGAPGTPVSVSVSVSDPVSDPVKKIPAEEPPEPKNPRHKPTIDLFMRLWADLRGGTYRLVGARDGAAVKQLLRFPEATEAEVERRMRFALADEWFRKHGNLTVFVSQWSNHDGGGVAPPKPRDKQRDENEAARVLAQSLRDLHSSLPEADARSLAAEIEAADALEDWGEVQTQRAAVLAKWRKAAA